MVKEKYNSQEIETKTAVMFLHNKITRGISPPILQRISDRVTSQTTSTISMMP